MDASATARRLSEFAASGLSIQGPASRAVLGLAALALVTGGDRLRPPAHGGGMLPEGTYTRLVQAMQDRADAELGFARVVFVDRSAAPSAEAERLGELLPGISHREAGRRWGGEASHVLSDVDDDGPSTTYSGRLVPDGAVCIVAGPPPDATVEDILGPDAADAGATPVQAFAHAMWREVGLCGMPGRTADAEAFAARVSRLPPDVARAIASRPVDGDGPDGTVEAAVERAVTSGEPGDGLVRAATLSGYGSTGGVAVTAEPDEEEEAPAFSP